MGALTGRIMKGIGGLYSVLIDSGDIVNAVPRGILRKKNNSPYPGDLVVLSESGDPDIPYCIDSIMPRKSFIVRPAVANIDMLFIVCSITDPPLDYYFLEKMIILSCKEGIEPVICITKADKDDRGAREAESLYEKAGFRTYLFRKGDDSWDVSDILNIGIKDRTIAFAGHSGVGKSTLFNKLIGHEHMDVGIVSEKSRKGKHTTRHSEIIKYDDVYIADTPGFSTLELNEIGVTGEDVENAYPELLKLRNKCRFLDCRHLGEKGCKADELGMDPSRLKRYRFFRKQVDGY